MTALFWVGAGGLLLIALAFLLTPLWRERARGGHRSLTGVFTALAIVPISLGLYVWVSTYDADRDLAAAQMADNIAVLEQLAARLGASPDDVAGWTLLGRSYLELGEYARARQALQEAWSRTASPDDVLKLSYAESMLFTEPATALTTAGELVDQVLATSPGNQRALWWGGLVALERNEPVLAVQRWTAFLETNPPQELADIVRTQIVELAAVAGGVAAPAAPADGPVIALEIEVAASMPIERLGANAIVYLLARAPGGVAGPPLAAKQIPLSSLPGRFELGVADAMLPGRSIAGQDRVTVIARISLSGEPTEQPGDLYGEVEVDVAGGEPVRITIDRIVPSA